MSAPCDYPMDGLGAARYVRSPGPRCPRCGGPVFPAAYIPDVLCCPRCSALWPGPGPDDCQEDGRDADYLELRCGCEVHRSDVSHDIADCLERQADELAYRHELRGESGA
jgi:hypothetical protein